MEQIDEIIVGLIDTYGTNCPYKLCAALGIDIIKVDKTDYILCKNNSAYIRNYFESETIFIRNDLDEEKEVFYIKHELGHAILHPNIQNSLNKRLLNKHKIEKQANYFAFKLSNVQFDEIELEDMTLEQIASCVGIPHAVLKQLANF